MLLNKSDEFLQMSEVVLGLALRILKQTRRVKRHFLHAGDTSVESGGRSF